MMRRLSHAVPYEWIDRGKPLRMQFEGRAIEAFSGDTLSSALAGAGVMITARSFKYHRPRGIFSAAGHDANNLFQIGAEPNQRGDHVLARDALAFSAVNTRGGVAHRPRGCHGPAVALPAGGLLLQGLHGPAQLPALRAADPRVQRLGKVDLAAAGALRERRHAHCEVAVIGAGCQRPLRSARGRCGRRAPRGADRRGAATRWFWCVACEDASAGRRTLP